PFLARLLRFISGMYMKKTVCSIHFAHIRSGVRRNLHAPHLRLLMDDHRHAVFREVRVGRVHRRPGFHSGAPILPAWTPDAPVRSAHDAAVPKTRRRGKDPVGSWQTD